MLRRAGRWSVQSDIPGSNTFNARTTIIEITIYRQWSYESEDVYQRRHDHEFFVFLLWVTLFSLFSEEIICNEVIRWDSHKVLVHTCEFQKFEENDISIHIIHRWWRSWAFLSRFQLPNHLTWSRLVPPPCPSEPHHLVCRKWGEGLSGDSVTDRESIRDLFVVNGQIAILEVGIFYDWWVETTHTACVALGRSGTSPNETKREPFRTVVPIWGQTI